MKLLKKYYISYRFKFGRGTCGGIEEVDAPNFEAAIEEARARHSNVKLEIRSVRGADKQRII